MTKIRLLFVAVVQLCRGIIKELGFGFVKLEFDRSNNNQELAKNASI